MALPINITDLITGTTVEWERIEFKEGWNDLDVLQTMCAFANDFGNLGGGYIIIGVAESNGKPILPPKGLTPEQANKIQSELLNLCKQRISPNYTPIVVPVNIENKLVLIAWCPGGQERPYEAPESFVKGASRNYYIRKFSNTVKPSKTEREELLQFAAIPYDDRIHHKSTLNDLSPGLVRAFLHEIGSKLSDEFDTTPFLSVCRQMNLVEGPPEFVKPKNFALMFFNDHPERIFPKAQIEVVNFQTPIADKDFTEIVFSGPLHIQLKDALRYLKSQVVKEKVEKLPYQAEAVRSYNFPYDALEEILANAVYHKNYQVAEPIEIRIHPDKIHVISFPGPDPSIKMEDLQTGNVLVRRYRNRQIGNILKELRLTEGKCTGIPTILKSMKSNGSPEPVFITDADRQSLLVTVPVHPAFLPSAADEQSTITPQILKLCLSPKSRNEILTFIQYSNHYKNYKKFIFPLVQLGLLALTRPNTPNDKNQQYVTTPAGNAALKTSTLK